MTRRTRRVRPVTRLFPRVGLAITGTEICAAVVRRTKVLRVVAVTRDDTTDRSELMHTLDRVLGELRADRFVRRPMVAALGVTTIQTRRLTHLPLITDRRVVASLLRTNVGRFFRKNGKPLVISEPELGKDGESWGWATATEEPWLDELRLVCASHRLELRAVIPAPIAVSAVTTDRSASWREGDLRIDVSFTPERRLDSLRLTKTEHDDVRLSMLTLRADLHDAIGSGCPSIATLAAIGATFRAESDPLAIRVTGTDESHRRSRRRLLIATVAFCVGLIAWLGMPVLALHRTAIAAVSRQRRRASDERAAASTQSDLSRTTAVLTQLARFSQSRRSATQLLAALARALPEESTLEDLRFDETGGSMVVGTGDPAGLLAEVDRVPELTGASIVGTLAPQRENGNAAPGVRITVRFQWKSATRAPEAKHDNFRGR